jgi:hypothetical protein
MPENDTWYSPTAKALYCCCKKMFTISVTQSTTNVLITLPFWRSKINMGFTGLKARYGQV